MVMCLGQGADLHMAQLKPLPLTISCCSKSRLVSPFWCQLIQVVPDKIQEGRKTVVCVCVCVCKPKLRHLTGHIQYVTYEMAPLSMNWKAI